LIGLWLVGFGRNLYNMLFDTMMGRVCKGEPDRLVEGLVDGRWRRMMDDDMVESRDDTWTQQNMCHAMSSKFPRSGTSQINRLLQ
jgi:hypothetical protein